MLCCWCDLDFCDSKSTVSCHSLSIFLVSHQIGLLFVANVWIWFQIYILYVQALNHRCRSGATHNDMVKYKFKEKKNVLSFGLCPYSWILLTNDLIVFLPLSKIRLFCYWNLIPPESQPFTKWAQPPSGLPHRFLSTNITIREPSTATFSRLNFSLANLIEISQYK